MKSGSTLSRKVVVAACCTAIVTALLPSAAIAAEGDLAQKIEALQKEIDVLTAQMKTVQAQPAAVGGSVVSAPAGLEFSIYGVGHLSADHIDTGADSSGYIHSNSSRLGFKGSYDLGLDGVAAIFQYESGVDLTGHGTGDGNGGGVFGNTLFTRARDSFVGVRGVFGTAVVGRLAAHNQWLYDYNLFGDQVGDLGNIWGQSQPGRLDSAVQYRTPEFGGFSAALTYDPSGNQGMKDAASTVLKLDFGGGGLRLGGAYASYGQGPALPEQKAAAITASYDFGIFNVGGGWQRETDLGGVSGANRNEATIGAAAKLGGKGTVKVQYARAGSISGIANSGARQAAIGYDHAWNGQTTLYVAYARTTNDSVAAFPSYDWGHGDQGVPGVAIGQNTTAVSVGLVYKFDVGLIGKR
jgi:predicted porin